MDKSSPGVPSVKGMKNAFFDYLVGALGGIILNVSTAVLGGNLIGSLAGPVLAGSVIKGARGTALSTIMGVLAFSGQGGSSAQSTSTDNGRWIE